ncbi:MAG TPA: hypothetical protein VF423_01705, partial [Actinomycetes bacterium]
MSRTGTDARGSGIIQRQSALQRLIQYVSRSPVATKRVTGEGALGLGLALDPERDQITASVLEWTIDIVVQLGWRRCAACWG